MKKTMFRLAGLMAVASLFAFVGAGCASGGDDAVVAPKTGAGAGDNPSVGQPVTSETTGGGGSGKGAPGEGLPERGR